MLFWGVLSPIQIISLHCYTCCVMLSIAAGWYDRYVEFFNNTLPNNQTLLDMWKNHLKLWEENVSLSSTVESLYFVGGSIFVEFVRTSYQGINILHKLRNKSINILIHKILFFVCKYRNTRSYVPTNQCNFSNPWKLVPMNFNDITVYICTISISIQFQYNCASIKAS